MPYLKGQRGTRIADRSILVLAYLFCAHLATTQISDGSTLGSRIHVTLAYIMLFGSLVAAFGAGARKYQIEYPAVWLILAGVIPLVIFVWSGYFNGRYGAATVDLSTLLLLGMGWRLNYLRSKAQRYRDEHSIMVW